jgi:hypothetical protein
MATRNPAPEFLRPHRRAMTIRVAAKQQAANK